MSDGGKGHAPRQKRDDDAFRRNWEAIFGEKRKVNTHEFDEDSVCIHCGFDGAEFHWWKHSTYEGRAAAENGEAKAPPCDRR